MTQDQEPEKFQFPHHRQSSSLETFEIPCSSSGQLSSTPSLALSTDTALVDDLIDELISLESSGGSMQISSPVDAESVKQRKHNHNMIERRRRYNINDKIKELGNLLPKGNEKFNEVVQGAKLNKGTILTFSVDYVKCLKNEIKRLQKIEEKFKGVEKANGELLEKNKSLELKICALQESGPKPRVYLQHRRTLPRSFSQPQTSSFAVSTTQQQQQHFSIPPYQNSTVDFSAVSNEEEDSEDHSEISFLDMLL